MPLLRWKSPENMKTFHRRLLTGHTAAILKEIPVIIYDGLILEAQNHREMAHFIAACGRALRSDHLM